ncbi:MAG: DegT/DnrJ/EryC1/StrS family aminotransferase, partial [Candidatus Diapherotrites archaeon]|nr:DegT/DnrJ/EryC1/StrS family aminotransferase [Candidatus Diapherotrites archaeon]
SGCKPVFADINYDTCNISADSIKRNITKNTVAIMPVHFAGQSCNMDELTEIANEYGLKIIEDSAEAIGSTWKGKKTGSQNLGCFSFFPTKNFTTGEGGMITTNDNEIAQKVIALKGHGILSSTWAREKEKKPWLRAATFAGYNYRMPDILAAIGVEQLKKLDKMNEMRIKSSRVLNKELSKLNGIEIPFEQKNTKHTYQMYTIKLSKNIDRSNFIAKLKEKGVQASVHFDPPVHLQPYYLKTGWKKEDLKVTEDIANRIVTLPMYPQIQKENLEEIINAIKTTINDLFK